MDLIKFNLKTKGKLKSCFGFLDRPSKKLRELLFKELIKEIYEREGGKCELANLEVSISYKYFKVEK